MNLAELSRKREVESVCGRNRKHRRIFFRNAHEERTCSFGLCNNFSVFHYFWCQWGNWNQTSSFEGKCFFMEAQSYNSGPAIFDLLMLSSTPDLLVDGISFLVYIQLQMFCDWIRSCMNLMGQLSDHKYVPCHNSKGKACGQNERTWSLTSKIHYSLGTDLFKCNTWSWKNSNPRWLIEWFRGASLAS